ncbi:tyrosyl-DNA phosphodiesterase I [Mycena sanguinolenta]|nr:tyrosyl-DNA phosphodiesterase I [Mycena sanguinolenta]
MDSKDDAPSLETQQAKTRVKSPSSGRRIFPDGAVLRVDTMHATKAETPGIRLGGVLGPRDELAFAILSSFIVNPEWIYSFFDPATPVVLVADPAMSGGDPEAWRPALKTIFPNWVRVCPPLSGGRGIMHMKYMLLFAKSGALRIVIGSANLVASEWRHLENYVFIQDFPRATPGVDTVKLRAGEKPSEAFLAVLVDALRATGVEQALATLIRQGHTTLPLPTLVPSADTTKAGTTSTALERGWDWSRVRVALVSSVPGKWEGWAGQRGVLRTGQTRLLRAVQALGCSVDDWGSESKGKDNGKAGEWRIKSKGESKETAEEYELELDYLTSSIGSYSVPWLAVFRLCAGGQAQALRAYLDRGQHRIPAQGPTRVIYPTLETIRGTVLGEAGASSISCLRAHWTKIAFLIANPTAGLQMRDAKSRSGGVGMHTKMILGTLRSASTQDDDTKNEAESKSGSDVEVADAAEKPSRQPHAWLYVGSHNFSVSAWGALSGSGFNPVLNIVNYELGVVLRLERPEDVDAAVAWERPTRKYIEGDVPWIPQDSDFFK